MKRGRIQEYILKAGSLTVGILDRGATISKILFPDQRGRILDLTLGYDTAAQYQKNYGFFGVTVGRCTNRIENACFSLNGQQVFLTKNAGPHHIHGGSGSFALQDFQVVQQDSSSITLRLFSPDGQDGYPGNLNLDVTYVLAGNCLDIIYKAVCNKDTIANLTNHAYFNLDGSGSILRHTALSPAKRVCFSNPDGIPSLDEPVANTPFDFHTWNTLDAFQRNPHPQTEQFSGYDHHFLIDGEGLRPFITVRGETSGIQMDVYSTQEGFQLYTANNLRNIIGKGFTKYTPYAGFCVEAQTAPNAANRPFRRGVFLRSGEIYFQKTTYMFSVFNNSSI